MKENKVSKEAKNETSNVSHSKQKRIDRQKKESKKKVENLVLKIVGIVIAVAIIALIAWRITDAVIKASNEIVSSNEFSKELSDNGFVKGVKASDYVTLCDYKNIKVPLADVEYPDSSVDEDIATALSSHQVLKDEGVEIADGDKVNIDYVGSIDGVEFEGGNSNGEGSDLTIGSGTFIDDFEQQLIGAVPGETVLVEVTFPEDYSSEDLAGKDAEFVVTVNGVYVDPDFDDDFVCAYYADYATTAEGYRQYLKDKNYEDNLTQFVTDYISDNTVANKYPRAYLKNFEETTKYSEEQSYEYMNQMYQQYYGQGYSSFEEYMGQTEEEYLANLVEDSKVKVKDQLAYQAILENEGIELTADDLKAHVAEEYGSDDEETYNSLLEEYGQGYLMLDLIKDKAIEIAKNNAVVE